MIETEISLNRPNVLHLLYALHVAILAIPAYSAARANHAKSAKHIDDCHVFIQTCTHWFKREDVFKSHLFKDIV